MKKIIVTGGSGRSGPFVIRELLAHGYEVRNLDIAEPGHDLCSFVRTDVTDYGAMFAAMHGFDAIVHLAANPHPDRDHATGAARFDGNTVSTFNAFQAAVALGMKKVVWASSETVLGHPFERSRPVSVPVDESHSMLPQHGYGLSKAVSEHLAGYMNGLYGVPFIGLRFSNILYEDTTIIANYSRIPGYWEDVGSRRFNLWSYVDARDVAQSARLSLECDIAGSENFIIAAADTIMRQTNAELMAATFPDVPLSPDLGDHETLISIRRARERLGYRPAWSWRQVLAT